MRAVRFFVVTFCGGSVTYVEGYVCAENNRYKCLLISDSYLFEVFSISYVLNAPNIHMVKWLTQCKFWMSN